MSSEEVRFTVGDEYIYTSTTGIYADKPMRDPSRLRKIVKLDRNWITLDNGTSLVSSNMGMYVKRDPRVHPMVGDRFVADGRVYPVTPTMPIDDPFRLRVVKSVDGDCVVFECGVKCNLQSVKSYYTPLPKTATPAKRAVTIGSQWRHNGGEVLTVEKFVTIGSHDAAWFVGGSIAHLSDLENPDDTEWQMVPKTEATPDPKPAKRVVEVGSVWKYANGKDLIVKKIERKAKSGEAWFHTNTWGAIDSMEDPTSTDWTMVKPAPAPEPAVAAEPPPSPEPPKRVVEVGCKCRTKYGDVRTIGKIENGKAFWEDGGFDWIKVIENPDHPYIVSVESPVAVVPEPTKPAKRVVEVGGKITTQYGDVYVVSKIQDGKAFYANGDGFDYLSALEDTAYPYVASIEYPAESSSAAPAKRAVTIGSVWTDKYGRKHTVKSIRGCSAYDHRAAFGHVPRMENPKDAFWVSVEYPTASPTPEPSSPPRDPRLVIDSQWRGNVSGRIRRVMGIDGTRVSFDDKFVVDFVDGGGNLTSHKFHAPPQSFDWSWAFPSPARVIKIDPRLVVGSQWKGVVTGKIRTVKSIDGKHVTFDNDTVDKILDNGLLWAHEFHDHHAPPTQVATVTMISSPGKRPIIVGEPWLLNADRRYPGVDPRQVRIDRIEKPYVFWSNGKTSDIDAVTDPTYGYYHRLADGPPPESKDV